MSSVEKSNKRSLRVMVYVALMFMFLIVALIFAYVGFSLVGEYGNDGVGSALVLGGVPMVVALAASGVFWHLWRKTLR